MDAIRKKMQSLKSETDHLFATIAKYEKDANDSNTRSDHYDGDIRELGKKITYYESDFDDSI